MVEGPPCPPALASSRRDPARGRALDLGAPRVHLWVDVDDAASQATARRAGFTQEGVVRAALDRRDGSRADAVLFGRVAVD